MTKRLFIFAGYDKDNIVDPTLLHYLNALSKLGDIVFTMDNDASDTELAKIRSIPNVLHADATRHGEYDFGSYKRGYIWAQENKILNKYDWVYLVNDSVYGPLWDIDSILCDLESRGVDMTGLVMTDTPYLPQSIQSWFIGLNNKIVTSEFFNKFLINVVHQKSKSHVVLKYEVRLSRIALSYGYKISALYHDKMTENTSIVYDNPKNVLDFGIPFVKKMAIKHKTQIEYMLPYTTDEFIEHMICHAVRHNCPDKIPYQQIRSFKLFGVPIYSVKARHTMWGTIEYKIYIFKKIPILKYTRGK